MNASIPPDMKPDSPPDRQNLSQTLYEHLFFFLFGGLTGSLYGLVLASAAGYFFTHRFSSGIVYWCAGMFGMVGLFSSSIVGEALIGLLHFLWRLLCAFMHVPIDPDDEESRPHWRALLVIGLITGIALVINVR